MKKIILLAALALGATAAQAQVTVEGSKFSDNWSITLKGGATSPAQNYAFWKNARGIFGLELRKQITPVFGLGVEGEWTVNTSSWSPLKSINALDNQYVGVFGTVNLMNVFAGYKGSPRPFEIEAVAGTGWIHSFYPTFQTSDGNSWGNKVGLNFNFNLGESKAWTIAIKPAILWNMNAAPKATNMGYSAQYNFNHAAVEMEAGVTYHFKNSNGTHSFTIARLYDPEEIAALNAEINALRAQLDACGADNAALQARIAALENDLQACLNRPMPTPQVVEDLQQVHYVFFNLASSTIEPLQQPEVDLVATELKNNADAKVTIDGYASVDGSKAFNEKLADKRAQAVKRELVNKYGIAESRINAQGKGILESFSKQSWNRCAICTVE